MDPSQFTLHAEIEDRHWWFRARREILFDQLRRHVAPFSEKLIVEIGCGTGGNLKFLQSYYNVLGVDTSPEAVGYAKDRLSCDVYLGDFRSVLKEKWTNIDAVILPDVLEHIEDDKLFFARYRRAFQRGNRVPFNCPGTPVSLESAR